MAGLLGAAGEQEPAVRPQSLDELGNRHGEFEAGLSIGLPRRDAGMEVCRPSASQALIPALDQTRTVGLVTLPGAFVGMLLAGAHPLAAGATQLFVLVALLAVETVAVTVTLELVVRGRIHPAAALTPHDDVPAWRSLWHTVRRTRPR